MAPAHRLPVLLAGVTVLACFISGCETSSAAARPPSQAAGTASSVRVDETAGRLILYLGSARVQFAQLPAGRFRMGGNEPIEERGPTEFPRDVAVRAFWIGTTELSQGAWLALAPLPLGNSSAFDEPVGHLTWNDGQKFLTALNRATAGCGWSFRLPTETEWEYACRAGTDGPYHAPSLSTVGWYSGNSGYRVHPVGTKQANAWGLFDMHGNVWEWCEDVASDLTTGAVFDGGSYRMLKGGSAAYNEWDSRAARRWWSRPDKSDPFFGMRLVAEREAGRE